MCKNRPCWGTPEDIEKIKAAGYSHKLMMDYWYKSDEEDIPIEAPAIVGYEGKDAPFWPSGQCTFLENDRCILHDLGLKPTEGRLAHCSDKNDLPVSLHETVAMTWKKERDL